MRLDIREEVRAWAEAAAKVVGECANEEQTKLAIVIPFFERLGYDARRPEHVMAEALAGIASVRPGRADLALRDARHVNIVVECKSAGETNSVKHVDQLSRYAKHFTSAHVGVLTNGCFFNFHMVNNGELEREPLLKLDIETIRRQGLSSEGHDFLNAIKAADFDPDLIDDVAKKIQLSRSLPTWWQRQLASPTDSFTRFLLKDLGYDRPSRKMIERCKPLLFDQFLGLLAKKVHEILPDLKRDPNGIVRDISTIAKESETFLTDGENRFYQESLIKIATGAHGQASIEKIMAVRYKDYLGHFSIYFGEIRDGLIVRYFEDQGRYEFKDGTVLTDPAAMQEPLVRNFLAAVAAVEKQG